MFQQGTCASNVFYRTKALNFHKNFHSQKIASSCLFRPGDVKLLTTTEKMAMVERDNWSKNLSLSRSATLKKTEKIIKNGDCSIF